MKMDISRLSRDRRKFFNCFILKRVPFKIYTTIKLKVKGK